MQLLFFFCTMLIILSDAFPKEFPLFPTNVRKQNSEFASNVTFPRDFIISSHANESILPFFVSKNCNKPCDFLHYKKYFNQRKRRSRKGKRNLIRENFPVSKSSQYYIKNRLYRVCCFPFLSFHGKRKKPQSLSPNTSYVWRKGQNMARLAYKNRLWMDSQNPKLKKKRCAKSRSGSISDNYKSSDVSAKMTGLSTTKANFKYSYNPKNYNSHVRNDPAFFKKNYADDEDYISTDVVYDLGRLKSRLKDDGNALDNQDLNSEISNDSNKEGNTTVVSDDIKAKIDVAIPILSQISEELSHRTNTSTSATESVSSTSSVKKMKFMKDLPKKDPGCSADGTWLSRTVGLEINVTTLPNKMLKVTVVSAKKDGVVDKKWAIQGLTLSKTGGPLILAAVYPQKKKIASFIGQCKICQGEELMVGAWTISKCALKCSDLWTTVETKLDVFKRIKKDAGKKKKGS